MIKRTKEYDAFGPWIYMISEEHALPRLFAPYKDMIDGALMSIKIPRQIERRNANSDMDLYDAVVAVFKSHIIFLKRDEHRVKEIKIKMADIVAVENSHFFLFGKVTIYTRHDKQEITYNTVSQETIELLVNIILMHMEYKEHKIDFDFLHYDTETIDYLFAHIISKMRKNDDKIGLIAYQPKYELQPKKDIISRLLEAFNKGQQITCTAFLVNPKKIVIINRTSPLKEGDEEDYAYTYIYLPIHNATNARIKENKDDMNELLIYAFDHEFSTKFNEMSKGIEELRYFLSGVEIA